MPIRCLAHDVSLRSGILCSRGHSVEESLSIAEELADAVANEALEGGRGQPPSRLILARAGDEVA